MKLTKDELAALPEELRWLYRKAYDGLHVSGRMRVDRIFRRTLIPTHTDPSFVRNVVETFTDPEE